MFPRLQFWSGSKIYIFTCTWHAQKCLFYMILLILHVCYISLATSTPKRQYFLIYTQIWHVKTRLQGWTTSPLSQQNADWFKTHFPLSMLSLFSYVLLYYLFTLKIVKFRLHALFLVTYNLHIDFWIYSYFFVCSLRPAECWSQSGHISDCEELAFGYWLLAVAVAVAYLAKTQINTFVYFMLFALHWRAHYVVYLL